MQKKTLFSCTITILDHTLYGKVKREDRTQNEQKLIFIYLKNNKNVFVTFINRITSQIRLYTDERV